MKTRYWILGSLMMVLLAGNVLLGQNLFEWEKITLYETWGFKDFLQNTNTALDNINHAIRDNNPSESVARTNGLLEYDIGLLDGLRTNAEKRGIDLWPIIEATRSSVLSENPTSSDMKYLHSASKKLSLIQTGLKGTKYQNGQSFDQLKVAVSKLNEQLQGMNE